MNRSKLNWLRAGVLGANDGIISVSVILISVLGNLDLQNLLLVGVSSIIAGALSMAIGEYVSVSAQKDAEKQAQQTELTNPYHAAFSSFLAFVVGAFIPFLASLLTQNPLAVVIAVISSLLITTTVSVYVGNVKSIKPYIRNLTAGALALTIGLVVNYVFGV